MHNYFTLNFLAEDGSVFSFTFSPVLDILEIDVWPRTTEFKVLQYPR